MTSSGDLVTLVVSGTFSVLPNRTIAIDRPTIDPSSIPVPVKAEFIPTSTSSPFLVAPSPGHHLNDKLRIGLLAGLLGPIVLCIVITLIVRYRTAILARKLGIKFSFLTSWRNLTPPVTRRPIGLNPVYNVTETGPPSKSRASKGKGKMPRFPWSRSKVPDNVGTRVNRKGQVEYYCTNHDCPIDPETWICEESGDKVASKFRSTDKPKGLHQSRRDRRLLFDTDSGTGSGAGPSMSQVRDDLSISQSRAGPSQSRGGRLVRDVV